MCISVFGHLWRSTYALLRPDLSAFFTFLYKYIQDQHPSLIIQNRFLHYMAYNLLRRGGIMRSFLAQMDQFIGLLMPAGRYLKHTYTVQYICTMNNDILYTVIL